MARFCGEIIQKTQEQKMIYVCEYDGTAEAEKLLELGKKLPIALPETIPDGPRGEKLREHILAWMLLEYSVYSAGGQHLKDMDIRRTKYGKPYSASCPGLHFNVSHCETACACITDTAVCGIDIEKKFAYRDNLARKICHSQEWQILCALDEEGRKQALQILWSVKESFVKMDGRGIGYGMNQANMSGTLRQALLTSAGEPIIIEETDEKKLYFLTYCSAGYTLAACSMQPGQRMVRMTEEKLVELFSTCPSARSCRTEGL